MTDRQAGFEKIAAQYKQETGVSVVFKTFAPSDIYQQKIITAIQGNTLPDIFGVLSGEKDFASFINAGYVLDLTKDMNDGWKDELFEKAVINNSFEAKNQWNVPAGIYAVPIDVNNMMILYNRGLFKKAGLDPLNPPKTWSEFLSAGRKLREAGIQPFVGGFGEAWMLGSLAYTYQLHILGRDKIVATIEGRVPYNDPAWIRTFALFQEMYEAGMFASGVGTMINKYAEQTFANERAAMALNGSWCVNVYHGMNSKLDYGAMLPPAVEGAAYPVKIWGGGGSSLCVNAKSPRSGQAVAFLKWLTAARQQEWLANETRNIPSNKTAVSKLSPLLATFTKAIDNTWEKLPVQEDWEVVSAINIGLQSIIIGEKNAAQVADEIQALKLKVSAARKRE